MAASWQSQHLSVKKTKKKWNKIMRSKWSLIRPNCVRNHFWSDTSALEEVMIRPNCARICLWSDPIAPEVVMIRPNCVRKHFWSDKSALEEVMIRPNCARICLWSDLSDQINLWSDHIQTIVQTVVRSNFLPEPVISVWEHTAVRSTGSDHKPIWVWTSTWAAKIATIFRFNISF